MSIRNLDCLLNPKSVALIGASDRAGSLGSIVWNNLCQSGFKGPLFAINLKNKAIRGVPVTKWVRLLSQPPELAVICTPAQTVPGLIAELGLAKVKAAVIITASLSAEQKQAVLNAARPTNLRILGPNCLGIMTPGIGLNASFSQTTSLNGDLALISQSGALTTAILDWAKFRGIGFSHLISLGECADVDFADLLDALGSDSNTRAIIVYIESIQQARKFMSAARAAARNKPVIVLKSGRSQQGAIAANTHSGALAGSDLVFEAAIRRAGMLRVNTLQEFFTASMVLTKRPLVNSTNLTIVTNGGGAGVIAADCADAVQVELSTINSNLVHVLDQFLPRNWSKSNPIDIIGDAPVERYTNTLKTLLAQPNTATVLLVHAPTAMVSSEQIAMACVPAIASHKRRVMGCWLGDESVASARGIFQKAGIADYATPEEAITAFAMLQRFYLNQNLLLQCPPIIPAQAQFVTGGARKIVDSAISNNRSWLLPAEIDAIFLAYGIKTLSIRCVDANPMAAIRAANQIGYPVALKMDSDTIQHKTEFGGVMLGIKNDLELGNACEKMISHLNSQTPAILLKRFVIQAMAPYEGTLDLLLGTHIDATFGPVVVFGAGGIAVELIADTAIALPPLNDVLAQELISSTQISKQMVAFRNRAAINETSIRSAMIAISCLIADIPEIAEIDINPLRVNSAGALALDARVRIDQYALGGMKHFAIAPYPEHLIEQILWRGQQLTIRAIKPEDETQHLRFIEQLSAEDVRMRIFFTKRELPRSELARLTQIDYSREMAFIIERDTDQHCKETLGTVRLVSDSENKTAEFAIVIRSDLKRQGLGNLLMKKMKAYAKQIGVEAISGQILRENIAMQKLACNVGFTNLPSDEFTGETVEVRLNI
jgi:acetyltransferase